MPETQNPKYTLRIFLCNLGNGSSLAKMKTILVIKSSPIQISNHSLVRLNAFHAIWLSLLLARRYKQTPQYDSLLIIVVVCLERNVSHTHTGRRRRRKKNNLFYSFLCVTHQLGLFVLLLAAAYAHAAPSLPAEATAAVGNAALKPASASVWAAEDVELMDGAEHKHKKYTGKGKKKYHKWG